MDRSRSEPVRRQTLPTRPNIEHLKNEAKARLKSLRAVNASTQLATAQKELAREYGFPSWRQLRAFVLGSSGTSVPEMPEEKVARLQIEQARPRREVEIDPSTLGRFVGFYELITGFLFAIRREGSGLIARLGSQTEQTVLPESDHKFFYKNTQIHAQLTFVLDGRDRASALILHQNGLEQTAKRIDPDAAKRVQEALDMRRTENMPSPGSEAAVQRLIREVLADQPDCGFMSDGLAQAFREQHGDNKRLLQSWGDVRSVAFVGVGHVDNADVFDVRFASCQTQWRISMEHADEVRSATFRAYP